MTSLIDRVAAPLRRLRSRREDEFDTRLVPPMILGAMLNPINSSIIAVSLIPIGIAFGAPPAETTWLVSSLYLATSIGQPVLGKLVDSFGPRRLYLIGTALVGIAGLMGVFAPNLGVLIAARVVLGFGTCAGYPTSMYLIRAEGRRTGRDSPQIVLTILSMATQTVLAVGPTLGGLLMSVGGWRATFAINVPLSIAALILGALRIPKETALQADRESNRPVRIDLVGIGLFAVMIIAVMLFLIDIRPDHWYLPVVGAFAGAGFVVRELQAPEPFIDLRVLGGNIALLATYLRTLLAMTVSYAMIYGFTQWLEDGRGLSPTVAGVVLLPLFVAGILAAAVVGRRKEIRAKLVVAAVALIIACAMITVVPSDAPLWLLLLITAVAGINNGLTSLANQNAVYYQAEPERIAASAGLLRTFGYLGSMVASAAQGALLKPTASTPAVHQLAIFMVIFAGLFLVMSLVDRSLSRVATAS